MVSIALPAELISLPQWVLWRYEDRSGPKPTKVPYQARTQLYHAKTDGPQTWASFDSAIEMWQYHAEHIDGIGFVFTDSDDFCGIDIDHIWSSDAAETPAWAQEILDRFSDTYSEESPSGQGAKIWCRAKAPRSGSWKVENGGVEIYSERRFFTVTGRSNRVLTIADHQEDVERLVSNLDRRGKSDHPSQIDGVIRYGTQHNVLVSLAGSMHRRGMSPKAIEAALLVVNQTQCEKPGPEEHIHKIVASMARWKR